MKNKLWQYILVVGLMFFVVYILGKQYIWGVNPKTIRNLSDLSEAETFVSDYKVSKELLFDGKKLKPLIIIEDEDLIHKIEDKVCIVQLLDKEDKLINSFELYRYREFTIIRMRGIYYIIKENGEFPF